MVLVFVELSEGFLSIFPLPSALPPPRLLSLFLTSGCSFLLSICEACFCDVVYLDSVAI
eukprot:m.58591 g.58591  ORF g.58591 m.58591 type:complete len:59 (+) comp19027_c1_seq1:277-453(+)